MYTSPADIRKKIYVTNYSYINKVCYCQYKLGGKDLFICDGPEVIAEKLREYSFIESWKHDGDDITVAFEGEIDEVYTTLYDTLTNFMQQLPQIEWIFLMSHIEYSKIVNGRIADAYKESFTKWHTPASVKNTSTYFNIL